MMKRKRHAGYTVVELVICLFILGLLVGLGCFTWVVIHFLLKVW